MSEPAGEAHPARPPAPARPAAPAAPVAAREAPAPVLGARGRAVVIGGLALALALAYALLGDIGWRAPAEVQLLLGTAAAVLALVAGASALVRHAVRREGAMLFLGTGLVFSGLLEGVQLWNGALPSPAAGGAADAGAAGLGFRVALAASLVAATWRRATEPRRARAWEVGAALAVPVGAALACRLAARTLGTGAVQLEALVAAALFLAALVGGLSGGSWRRRPAAFGQALFLVTAVVGEGLYRATASGPADLRDTVARLLEGCGAALLFLGFLRGTYHALRHHQAIAARRGEERFRALVQSSSDVIGILGGDGLYRYLSPAIERVLGYRPEERIGRPLAELTHPQDRPRIVAAVAALQSRPGAATPFLESRSRHRDGSWRVLESRVTNLLHEPAVEGLVVNLRDVTEKRLAQRAVRESQERYRRFFEEDLTGDAVIDADGRIVTCNPAFIRTFGFAAVEEATGCALPDLLDGPEVARQLLERLRREGKVERHELAGRRRDGEAVHLVANLVGHFDDAGKLIDADLYVFDDTERKRAQEQLRQAQKMEAVGRLAGGVAHDFNNILTAILFCAESLAGALEEEPLRRKAEEIKKAGDRAAALTRQLLAFSRRQVFQLRLLDLNEVVSHLESMLRRVIGEDVELVVQLDRTIGAVRADPSQLDQVIMNLAVNARDAMPVGGRLILETSEVTLDGRSPTVDFEIVPGPYVLLTVGDTGCGIGDELRQRIFEPFFTTKDRGRGTGLGLSTVYGIVKQSGGYIMVESELDVGTTFQVYLPRVEGETEEHATPSEQADQGGTERVLLAEDEDDLRVLLGAGLRLRGYRVIEAGNGAQALAVAGQEERIDLLVSDIVMPDIRGPELERRIRQEHPAIKTLFISGYAGDSDHQSGYLDPGAHFLQKPFTASDLGRKVREVLDA